MISWKKAYYYFMFTMVSSLAYYYFLMTRVEKCRLIWKLLKYHWKIAGNWKVSAPDLKKIPLRIPFNEVTYALKTMTWNFSKSELSQRNFLESFWHFVGLVFHRNHFSNLFFRFATATAQVCKTFAPICSDKTGPDLHYICPKFHNNSEDY